MFGSLEWTLSLLTLTVFVAVRADYPPPERLTGMNPCISKQTCHDCVQTPHCAWCSAPNFLETRCFLPSINRKIYKECPEEYTWNPDNVYSVIRPDAVTSAKNGYYAGAGGYSGYEYNASYTGSSSSSSSSHFASGSSASGSKRHEENQIWPQEVKLKLRINDAHRMSFIYSQAKDYPVDLYYLMDLSNSMEDDKQKLSDLGQLLVESMSKITSNFRLGFGSFVDKVVMPYVSVVPKLLEQPCTRCAKPYGYKNIMKLSDNTSVFADLVRDAAVSGNLDGPEGGFDAIMQAIVCFDEIGWRQKTRRLLVFSTDAGFHYAGDGKLGGIVRPNDGICHLDSTGLYTHSSLQDYPSISQINHEVKEKAINIIWAVTEGQIDIYKRLTKHIEGSFAGKLSEDSSNIVELIREQYAAISSSLVMKDTANSHIKVRYFSSCLGTGAPIETSKCDGLKVGDKVEFFAEIEVTSCPKNRSEWQQSFAIYPIGLSETLTVNLEMLCDCDCEHPTHFMYKEKAGECTAMGTLQCGVCSCVDGYFGKNCECAPHDSAGGGLGSEKYYQACRADNTSLLDCSGRGTCACGVCTCDKRPNEDEEISGRFCECDNFSCDRDQGRLCSDHGTCECGTCVCNKEWTGPACKCPSSDQSCIAPDSQDGLVCSGHGECVCGECVCRGDSVSRFSGKFCDKCPSCPDRCKEFENCIACQIHKSGNYTEEECKANCNEFVAEGVDVVPTEGRDEDIICQYWDEKGCQYRAYYFYNETNQLVVKAQSKKECPAEVYMLGIVLGVIAAIVLIGLAFLLLWKLLTTIHDRREFARFEKERMMAKWDTGENPIYKQATSTFKNPTYAGK